MPENDAYEKALGKLALIETVKAKLCALMDELCNPEHTGMRVSACDYAHATACVREAIDELFYKESARTRRIMETVGGET